MIQDLDTLFFVQKKLKTLDLGTNFIPTIENISHLTSLDELWVGVFFIGVRAELNISLVEQ